MQAASLACSEAFRTRHGPAPPSAAPGNDSSPADRGVLRHGQRPLSGLVRRWHAESTPLCAYLSHDGAIMLADLVPCGNAPIQAAHSR